MRLQFATREACERLLVLWERGLARPMYQRAGALLAADGEPPPRTLGEQTARLLGLHSALFGPQADLLSQCPACRSVASFAADCDALIDGLQRPGAEASHRLDLDGIAIEFRLPGAADLAAAATEDTEERFARAVVDRCVLWCIRHGEHVPVSSLPDEVLDAVSQRMEALDPAAAISFAVVCPDCGARWNAPLDVGRLLWEKVQISAERLLLDVDALARAYGWTEREILSLSPGRRAAYLQIVSA
jgi:hypothetical protein